MDRNKGRKAYYERREGLPTHKFNTLPSSLEFLDIFT